MIEIAKQIVEAFEDFGESFKTKEYVCYYRDNEGFIRETYLTKKELYKFINKHQLANMKIYKIKDRIEIERQLMPYLPHKSVSFYYANGREVLAKEILNIIEGGNNGK